MILTMKSKINMSKQFQIVILSVCILSVSLLPVAAADIDDNDLVVVKGTRLEGQILGFDSEGIGNRIIPDNKG